MSNLKQIGLGMMMYVQDYDEKYPPSGYYADTQPPGGSWYDSGGQHLWYWQQIIYPYTKNYQLYRCPSSTNTANPSTGNYGVNQNLVRRYQAGITINMSRISAPATVYLATASGAHQIYVDSGEDDVTHPQGAKWYVPGTYKYTGCSKTGCSGTSISSGQIADFTSDGRHFDGNNVLFGDGHVKWIKSMEMYNEAKKYKDSGYAESTISAWNPFGS